MEKKMKRWMSLLLAMSLVITGLYMVPADKAYAASKNVFTQADAVKVIKKTLGITKSGASAKKQSTFGYAADILSTTLDTDRTEILGKTKAGKSLTKSGLKKLIKKTYPNIISKTTSSVKKGNVLIKKSGVTIKNAIVKGNLVVGDGVGKGEATLNKVKVTKKLIVRGGGKNSVIIKGASKIPAVVIQSPKNAVSLKVQGKAQVNDVTIQKGSKNVNINGAVDKLSIEAPNIKISLSKATVGEIVLSDGAKNTVLTIDKSSTVKNVEINADGAEVNANGKVTAIKVNAKDNKVTTADSSTKVSVGSNATNANVNGQTKNGTKTSSGGSSGGSGGSGGSSASNYTLIRGLYTTWVGSAVGIRPVTVDNTVLDYTKLSYSSSDPSVAKVTGTNGCVVGVSEGTANIYITVPDGRTLTAFVKVYKNRTDAELQNNFYEYQRAKKLKELKDSGVTVKDGEEFCGYNLVEKNNEKSIAKYIGEVEKKVSANGVRSVYADNTPGDIVASLVTTYEEDANTQNTDLKNDITNYFTPKFNLATTTSALISLNANVLAEGGRGLWGNGIVNGNIDHDESKPGTTFFLALDVETDFALAKKSEYGENDAELQALKTLIDEILKDFGEEDDNTRSANVDKVIYGLKELAPEKTMQEVYAEGQNQGLDGDALYYYLEENDYGSGQFPVSDVEARYPDICFGDSIAGTPATDNTYVQITETGVLKRIEEFVNTTDADTLREVLKVFVAYPYYIETRKGFEDNYKLTLAKSGSNDTLTAKDYDEKYKEHILSMFMWDYGWETSVAYKDDTFTYANEQELCTMLERIRSEYKTAIENAPWMSETTRKNALLKLEKMEYDLFLPSKNLNEYLSNEDLKTAAEGGTLFTNIKDYKKGKWNTYGQWVDKNYYGIECYWRKFANLKTPYGVFSPLFANGSYEPNANCIGIFIGLLDKEMYVPGDTFFNYGRIGAAIAHEIGHAFDSNGMLYDEEGNKRTIIASEDAAKWQAKCDKLAALYANYSIYYEPESGKMIYSLGEAELPEIMSDTGGDEIVTRIIKKEYPGNDNLKKYYETISTLWTQELFDPTRKEIAPYDIHPHGMLRGALPIMVQDEFYEVYGIKLGDGCYLPPEYRTLIWSK